MTRSMLAAVMVVLAVAAPAAAPTGDTSGAWPSNRDARRVAVRATAASCRAVTWCTGYDVVPAHRCRRAEHRTVYCAVGFVSATRRRCGGVVGVKRARGGGLDRVMAVPQNCTPGAPADDDRSPTTLD
jgi:hypothetical protein